MVILKAIGAFFVKIWRWIKETAWVQPLLIVGAIFAIIFSIPYITDWANSLSIENSGNYFKTKKITLEGEVTSQSVSDADKFTETLYDNTMLAYEGTSEGIDKEAYGEKFFLVYTSDDCSGCTTAEGGFKFLSGEAWGDYVDDGSEFKLYSIFTDEDSTNDDDYEADGNYATAFKRYLQTFSEFFNQTGERLGEAPYKVNKSVSDTNYNYYEQPDITNFVTPTILLVDYTDEAIAAGRGGVSEVLFGVSGSTDKDVADVLANMWNHLSTDTTNPFSANYVKD